MTRVSRTRRGTRRVLHGLRSIVGALVGMSTVGTVIVGTVIVGIVIVGPAAAVADEWSLVDATAEAGFDHVHGFLPSDVLTEPHWMSGGVAAGDVDGDGWVDLYVPVGSVGVDRLYRNRGDGTFEDIAAAAGLVAGGPGAITNGPAFADLDGDGDLDLLVGGIAGAGPRLFRNRGSVGCAAPVCFEEVTEASGLFATADTFSSAFGDVDRDGDLDLFMAHWSGVVTGGLPSPHLWRNDTDPGGAPRFAPIDFSSGVVEPYRAVDWSFTPAFADLDGDGRVDLVVAGDFGTSQVFRNATRVGESIRFEVATTPAIDDENGMGSVVADLDGDGDFDWFVTSIWDPDGTNEGAWGVTGNRLYRNDSVPGEIVLVDATDGAGVREGYWGWGVCAADFDLDGALDLVHVNGFQAFPALEDFGDDPARLFLGTVDGAGFVEASATHGLDHTAQGRGVVCFDADRDGDVDVFIAANGGPPTFYRNDIVDRAPDAAWLGLRLLDAAGAPAVGAVVVVEVDDEGATRRLTRRVHADSHYLSQSPAEVLVGLGPDVDAVALEVRWPDGTIERLADVATRRWLTVRRGGGGPMQPIVDVPVLSPRGLLLVAAFLVAAALRRLGSGRRLSASA